MDSTDMTTNRTPIQRPALTMISPRAVELFTAMGKLRCTCPPPSPTREPRVADGQTKTIWRGGGTAKKMERPISRGAPASHKFEN
jgi:hypothetical protein